MKDARSSASKCRGQRIVFLDRDGVLNPDNGHPHRLEDAVLFPDVAPALRRLQGLGYMFAVVSNQSGVGRGYFDLEQVTRFNSALVESLIAEGISIALDQFFICPHQPADDCKCRKPRPGLLVAASAHLNANLRHSFIVGDRESDVEAGAAVGVTTILLNRQREAVATQADWVLHDLNEIADRLPARSPIEAGSASKSAAVVRP
jgi:D-glycero-D-manno-heptose 1,7-bisphosphate phosphatase